MTLAVTVVVTTFDQPRLLERALWGYACQTRRDFEVVVADDGSAGETRALIRRLRAETGLRIEHVWHEHHGFRKTEILNRAILESRGEYLIFSDGDCVPRQDFVEAHARLAERGRFLSGGCLRLPDDVSDAISVNSVRSGDAFRPEWLRGHGWRPGKRLLRLAAPAIARLLDAATPTRASFNGHNSSAWREHLLAVNGFDGDMGYGGLDRALGERLVNLGVTGKQIRYRAPVLHLHHPRGYVETAVLRRNREIREEIRRERRVRARVGIAELADSGASRSAAAAGGA